MSAGAAILHFIAKESTSKMAHWHTWHLQSLGVIASLGFGFLTYKMEIKHVLPLQGGRDNHEKIKSSATTVLSQQRLVTDHQ